MAGAAALSVVLLGVVLLVHARLGPEPTPVQRLEGVQEHFGGPDGVLAASTDGTPWAVVGPWEVQDGELVLGDAVPAAGGPATALLPVDLEDLAVAGALGRAGDGVGLAVRAEGPQDLVAVVASPSFGGYRVLAVESGVARALDQVPLAATAPATELALALLGDQLLVLVDRRVERRVDLAGTPDGDLVGLVALPGSPAGSSWQSFGYQSLDGLVTEGVVSPVPQ